MGIFNTIFGQSEEISKSKINWIDLNNLNQIKTIDDDSNSKKQLIFKHSTRCSVSRMVLKQFENEFDLHDKIDCYFLDLLEFRPISNEITSHFKIEHQSPQLLLIKNGIVIYHANHDSIDAVKLKEL